MTKETWCSCTGKWLSQKRFEFTDVKSKKRHTLEGEQKGDFKDECDTHEEASEN